MAQTPRAIPSARSASGAHKGKNLTNLFNEAEKLSKEDTSFECEDDDTHAILCDPKSDPLSGGDHSVYMFNRKRAFAAPSPHLNRKKQVNWSMSPARSHHSTTSESPSGVLDACTVR